MTILGKICLAEVPSYIKRSQTVQIVDNPLKTALAVFQIWKNIMSQVFDFFFLHFTHETATKPIMSSSES